MLRRPQRSEPRKKPTRSGPVSKRAQKLALISPDNLRLRRSPSSSGHSLLQSFVRRLYRRRPQSFPQAVNPEVCTLLAKMALTNFILTVAGVGAIILLTRSDVRKSATIFKRNVRQIRNWLEEESAAASKSAEKGKPKELETHMDKKDHVKEDKH